MLLKALKSCSKSNNSPNLVTLLLGKKQLISRYTVFWSERFGSEISRNENEIMYLIIAWMGPLSWPIILSLHFVKKQLLDGTGQDLNSGSQKSQETVPTTSHCTASTYGETDVWKALVSPGLFWFSLAFSVSGSEIRTHNSAITLSEVVTTLPRSQRYVFKRLLSASVFLYFRLFNC